LLGAMPTWGRSAAMRTSSRAICAVYTAMGKTKLVKEILFGEPQLANRSFENTRLFIPHIATASHRSNGELDCNLQSICLHRGSLTENTASWQGAFHSGRDSITLHRAP
jgi:hypothetical protein